MIFNDYLETENTVFLLQNFRNKRELDFLYFQSIFDIFDCNELPLY